MYMKEIWAREKEKKVVAVDLDGVLVQYPECWIDYVNKKIKKNFKDLGEMKDMLSYSEYRKLKRLYRTDGSKANLPAVEGATKFISGLQNAGYKIVIITSRPYHLYHEIYDATVRWLRNNKISPDFGIIWDAQKHWAVLREFPFLKFLVEDNAEIANQVARLGYKVYLLDNIYNRQPLEKNCQRIFSLDEILRCEVLK